MVPMLGPPEIHANFPGKSNKTTNITTTMPQPPMGFTENCSATFLSTGNPCLDFFFHVVRDTSPQDLTRCLDLAWDHDALTALKLICHLRGVRGTGKSEKEGFYTAAMWLHKHHPKTLACNVKVFADFGYFKDLLEILYRLLEGLEIRKSEIKEWKKRKASDSLEKSCVTSNKRRKSMVGTKIVIPKEIKIKAKKEKLDARKLMARTLRRERDLAKAKKALGRYTYDPEYRFLHEKISDLFAEYLKSDITFLNSNQLIKISLASKWCPSLDSSFDRATLMCECIARKVFPRENYVEYGGIEEAHYIYRVRDRLRKQILVPLRKALKLPEVFMCANQWGSLAYNRVASVAMKLYKDLFKKHDETRFQKYLENVKSGKAKIAAGALLPHEIIASLMDGDGGQVAELQWTRMVDDLLKKGKLTNCIAVCDVSGSMLGEPMEVCVALGLLISELSEEPWKGKVITFSARPQLHEIRGNSLLEKTDFISRMEWCMNTNFQKVFDRILDVAVAGGLSEDQMIQRVFVFSDMEFDEASTNRWETDYMVIQRKFWEKGYEKVPEIVFWNLRDSMATPVPSNQEGVALVSGFSKNLLKLFLEGGGVLNPEAVMQEAISGEEYKSLVVID